MKKIEAIIRPERLQDVQDALDELGVSGLTVTEVVGCGRQKGYTEQYRGSRANISLLPKIKVESVVPSDVVERGRRGDRRRRPARASTGDGRVFVYPDRAGGPHPHRRARRGDRACTRRRRAGATRARPASLRAPSGRASQRQRAFSANATPDPSMTQAGQK